MADELRVSHAGPKVRTHGLVPMPEKVPGKHRWIVLASHTVTAKALAAARRGEDLHLDTENLVGVYSGCVDCEAPYPSPEPCTAGDGWGDGRG